MLPICNIRLCGEKPHRLPLPDISDKSLGAELKRKRIEKEWTQVDCAKYFGILKDSCQKWEWNKITPHIKNYKKVIEFLGYNYWDDGSESLSNKCLMYRIEHGVTQTQMAEKVGLNQISIYRVESEKYNMSKDTIAKIKLKISEI